MGTSTSERLCSWGQMNRHTGLLYATCKSEAAAKKCLIELIDILVRAGVIEEASPVGSNRFDRVELSEANHE